MEIKFFAAAWQFFMSLTLMASANTAASAAKDIHDSAELRGDDAAKRPLAPDNWAARKIFDYLKP